ncbi:MAG: serine hydrolase [Candidatus Limnocylindrus sp.]
MSRSIRIKVALFLVAGLLVSHVGAPSELHAASGAWKACAARPVPPPPARPVDPALEERIQARVTTWRENRRTRYPGLSVALRWDDGREVSAVSGVADSNSGRRVTPATPFALASVSKPFTAAVALLLDACGVLPLSTRAASLVPYADVRPEATIEDLLRHEGGMSDWLTDKYTRMNWLIQHPNGKVGPKTAVQNLLPRGEIGDFDYSNSSFTLITLAAEKATGASWRELMEALIIKPLGLSETGFGPVAGASRTHIWSRGKMRPFGQPGWGPTRSAAAILRGAGDLFATPRDLATFGELLWGDRLLEGSQTQLINGIANLTGFPWSYTVGTMMDRSWLGGLRTYGHTGGYSGASTTLRHVPELGVTIAVTANGMGTPGNYADDLAINLIDLIDAAAPSSAQAIAGVDGAGLTAAERANPEPFPVVAPAAMLVCGDSDAVGTDTLAGTPRWVDLTSNNPDTDASDWSGRITALAELPDGRLLVGGTRLTRAGGVAVNGLAVRDPKRGTWRPFASLRRADGSVATVTAFGVDVARQRLYVGGDFSAVVTLSGRTAARGIAQFDLKSGRWSALGSNLRGSVLVRAISVDPATGRVAVGGRFTVPGKAKETSVALWDPASGWVRLASSTSAPLSGLVESVAIAPSGAIHAGGRLQVGSSNALIARWSTASGGWVASATSGALGDAARSLVIDGGGALMAGTGIGWYGATLVRESAISGYGWDRVGSGLTRARRTAWISALARLPDGRVAVGGAFDASGATSLQNLALWDPTRQSLTSIGSGLPAAPDALASSAHSLAYAAIRLRSAEPGGSGRPCITAWARPAPARPAAPTLVARRTQISVQWSAATSGSAPAGWIAEALARGHDTRTCVAVASERTCAITGLDPGTKYSVRLRAYAIPAGPSAASLAAKVMTKR